MDRREKRLRIWADGLLLLTAAIWGGGFVASKLALGQMTPAAVLAWRFLGAAATLLAVFFFRIRKSGSRECRMGILVGTIQFLALLVQLVGLQYTTPAKQSFICVMYVVMTPLIAWILTGEHPEKRDFTAGILALAGMALISLKPGLTLEIGDLITVGFTVLFALQLVVVGKYAGGVEVISFSFYQFLTAGVLSLLTALFSGANLACPSGSALAGVLYLMVINTALAFCLQNFAQRYTKSSHAAVLISLESVFGFLFSTLVFHDPITWKMLAGGGLMFGAVCISNLNKKTDG